jgi:hypothetical protein
VPDLVREIAVVLALLAPAGFAALKLAGRTPRGSDFPLALALGYATVLPPVFVELHTRVPGIALAVPLAATVWLRRDLRSLLPEAKSLLLPAAFLALGLWVSAGDFAAGPEGVSFRFGADVSDRALYALIAREVGRLPPPHSENPLFAGAPLTYSFFPALLALLFERYAGVSLLATFLTTLPALGLAFTALAADRLLLAMGVLSRGARAAAVVLAALGGELEFLLRPPNLTALERTRYGSLFWSQSDWLFYNTWMLAAPLALALLAVAALFLRETRRGDLVLAALLAGALFETKVFTLLPIALGAGLLVVLLRTRASLLLAGAIALGVAPWAAITWLSARNDPGFLYWAPLLGVARLFERLPALAAWAGGHTWLLLGLGTLAFLAVGFGARLLGLGALAVDALRDRTGYGLLVLATMLAAVAASLLFAVRPLWYDTSQFQLLPRFVLWLYAAPLLLAGLRRARWRWLCGLTLAAASLTTLHYVTVKKWPGPFTAPDSWDRKRQALSRGTVEAAAWLATHGASGDRFVMPLYDDPEDLAGMKPFYVAALAHRPLLASLLAFHVPLEAAALRGNDAIALYDTGDPAQAVAILERWRVRFVWEEAAVPLRFRSERLRPVFAAGSVRLWEFR